MITKKTKEEAAEQIIEKTADTKLEITFKDLGLSKETLEALDKKGFERPSPIQAQTIPLLLKGEKDIIGQAQTGTGKTAAFGIPLIEKLTAGTGNVQALILTPTRELAIQVAEEIYSLQGGVNKLSVVPIYGGQSYMIQNRALKKGVDIIVGTPGRTIDHINKGTLKLGNITNLILDEADEMLNMGFIDDMEEIIKHTNPEKRVLLFSATMPKEIKKVGEKYMKGYEHVSVKSDQMTTTQTEQIYFEVHQRDKFEALSRIIDSQRDFYGLIFCKTKVDVDAVNQHLNERGYMSESIHGDIEQKSREKVLKRFKAKKTTILVATDVAARGIDVNDISHVINYSLPGDPESYVHRIGRTGRAGKEGKAITFVTPSEYGKLMFFKKITKTDIKKGTIPKAGDVVEAKKRRFMEDLEIIISTGEYSEHTDIAKEILDKYSPDQVVAALIKMEYEQEFDAKMYNDISAVNVDRSGKVRLFIALGRAKGYEPRTLIDYICDVANVKARDIDDLRMMTDFSFINVPMEDAEAIIKSFDRIKPSGQRSLVSKAKEDKNRGGRSGGSRSGGYNRGGDRGGRSNGSRGGSGFRKSNSGGSATRTRSKY